MTRYALVRGARRLSEARAYLPGNYEVIAEVLVPAYEGAAPERCVVAFVIEGEDHLGWTLDDYVIPRYGSGSIACEEITAADPALQGIAAEARAWLLDLMWVEEEAHEQIENLDLAGVKAAIERHYEGGWTAFCEADLAGGAAA